MIDNNAIEIIRMKHMDGAPYGNKNASGPHDGGGKKKLNDTAMKVAKKNKISYQKIGEDIHIAFNDASFHTGVSKGERKWAKVTDKPTGKLLGKYGDFDIYTPGFHGSKDNDSYGYEAVLRKSHMDGAPYGNKNAAGPHDMSGTKKLHAKLKRGDKIPKGVKSVTCTGVAEVDHKGKPVKYEILNREDNDVFGEVIETDKGDYYIDDHGFKICRKSDFKTAMKSADENIKKFNVENDKKIKAALVRSYEWNDGNVLGVSRGKNSTRVVGWDFQNTAVYDYFDDGKVKRVN